MACACVLILRRKHNLKTTKNLYFFCAKIRFQNEEVYFQLFFFNLVFVLMIHSSMYKAKNTEGHTKLKKNVGQKFSVHHHSVFGPALAHSKGFDELVPLSPRGGILKRLCSIFFFFEKY